MTVSETSGTWSPARATVAGVLLAAGGGRRMGMPKALVRDTRGGWLERGVDLLAEAGCEPVIVVLGARAEEAASVVADDVRVRVVTAADWRAGMSASLRAGVTAAESMEATALLITLVDLPALTSSAAARVVGTAPTSASLRQATYGGEPGHPVLIGRDHWTELVAGMGGDTGARRYLAEHGAELVDCTDLGGGEDVDQPADTISNP